MSQTRPRGQTGSLDDLLESGPQIDCSPVAEFHSHYAWISFRGPLQPHKLDDGTAIDIPTLPEVGKKHGVRFLNAMQCRSDWGTPRPLDKTLRRTGGFLVWNSEEIHNSSRARGFYALSCHDSE
jgi:hypothetical protein